MTARSTAGGEILSNGRQVIGCSPTGDDVDYVFWAPPKNICHRLKHTPTRLINLLLMSLRIYSHVFSMFFYIRAVPDSLLYEKKARSSSKARLNKGEKFILQLEWKSLHSVVRTLIRHPNWMNFYRQCDKPINNHH